MKIGDDMSFVLKQIPLFQNKTNCQNEDVSEKIKLLEKEVEKLYEIVRYISRDTKSLKRKYFIIKNFNRLKLRRKTNFRK